jgi:DNA-binding response OmpR family regulator
MILILEDNLELAFLLCRILGRLPGGERCLATGNVAEAESRILAGEVSLLVSDLRLGQGSGIALLRHLHARLDRHALPVVVYTGLGPRDAEFREAGYYTDAIFEKGETTVAKLRQVVQSLCRRAGPAKHPMP